MAAIAVSIREPVGLRKGTTRLPNRPDDLSAICELFDRIPVAKGGCKEIGGLWASNREALIAEIATQIATFQTANAMATVDSAIDPRGHTLRLMN